MSEYFPKIKNLSKNDNIGVVASTTIDVVANFEIKILLSLHYTWPTVGLPNLQLEYTLT